MRAYAQGAARFDCLVAGFGSFYVLSSSLGQPVLIYQLLGPWGLGFQGYLLVRKRILAVRQRCKTVCIASIGRKTVFAHTCGFRYEAYLACSTLQEPHGFCVAHPYDTRGVISHYLLI